MSRVEDFHPEFWEKPEVRRLSANARLLYIWSFGNPRCVSTKAGIYRAGDDVMAAGTGLRIDVVPDAVAELERHRFAFHRDGRLWVRTRARYLVPKSKPMAKSVAGDIRQLPIGLALRRGFLHEYFLHHDPDIAAWLREHLAPLVEAEGGVHTLTPIEATGPEQLPIMGVSPTVTRPSLDGQGQGQGQGQVLLPPPLEGKSESDARADETALLVAEVIAILRRVPRLRISDSGIWSAITAHPHGNPILAAHTVVTWASDPQWYKLNAGSLLMDALGKQPPPRGGRAPRNATEARATVDQRIADLDDLAAELGGGEAAA